MKRNIIRAFVALLPAILIALGFLSMSSQSALAAETNPVFSPTGSSGHSIAYDHWSCLCVIETITDLGGGKWRYSYTFTNTETDAIWHFGVYTHFETENLVPFNFPGWSAGFVLIDDVFPIYDARNLDPLIAGLSNTWGNPW